MVNDFKSFAVSGGANVLSQAQYLALLTALTNGGFVAGVAPSAALNKVWRQSSLMAAVIGKVINDQTGADAIDDGTIATLASNLALAMAAASTGVAVSVVTTGGNTSLTAAQAASRIIFVSGNLASNATITLPATARDYIFINQTTGAFSLTVLTLGGAGIPIGQGLRDAVTNDGVNTAFSIMEGVTQTAGDASKRLATCEFVANAGASSGAPQFLFQLAGVY